MMPPILREAVIRPGEVERASGVLGRGAGVQRKLIVPIKLGKEVSRSRLAKKSRGVGHSSDALLKRGAFLCAGCRLVIPLLTISIPLRNANLAILKALKVRECLFGTVCVVRPLQKADARASLARVCASANTI